MDCLISSHSCRFGIIAEMKTLFTCRKEFVIFWVSPVGVAIATDDHRVRSASSPPLYGFSLTLATSLNPTSVCV